MLTYLERLTVLTYLERLTMLRIPAPQSAVKAHSKVCLPPLRIVSCGHALQCTGASITHVCVQ